MLNKIAHSETQIRTDAMEVRGNARRETKTASRRARLKFGCNEQVYIYVVVELSVSMFPNPKVLYPLSDSAQKI